MKFLNASEYLDRAVKLLTVDDRLPAGFITSPAISNACLSQLDDCFQHYCSNRNITFTRYCDDVIISGTSVEDVNSASIELTNQVKAHYEGTFEFNQNKVKFTKVGRKIKLLGMVILPNGVVTIDNLLKRKIEILLHYYITDSFTFLRLVNDDREKGIKSLAGYVSFVHAVDLAYLSKLRTKYSDSVIENLLRMPK
jgi:RNA-directed DNA polymerase